MSAENGIFAFFRFFRALRVNPPEARNRRPPSEDAKTKSDDGGQMNYRPNDTFTLGSL
jgi:hypothetical protein